jgi:ribosome recycling factor
MPTLGEAKAQMDKALEAMRREFNGVRTGKASASLLDTVRVDAYSSKLPLNQVATVNIPEARLLIVQPFDKSLLKAVERAIRDSDYLNPANDGTSFGCR